MDPSQIELILQDVSKADVSPLGLIELVSRIASSNLAHSKLFITAAYKRWIVNHIDHPAIPAILFNYAISLSDVEDFDGAALAYIQAIAINKDFFGAYINLGMVYERLGRPEKAIETWSTLLNTIRDITPEALEMKLTALKQSARVHEKLGNGDAATESLIKFLELDSRDHEVVQKYVAARLGSQESPILADVGRIRRDTLVKLAAPLSTGCFADDPMYQLATARRHNSEAVGYPKTELRFAPRPHMNRDRLRIGYVSSDLRRHAVGFAMNEMFELHSRDKFQIAAYYCGVPDEDDVKERARRAVDQWVDISSMSTEQAAQKIHDDQIDILVDLNGYTHFSRTHVFALKPTPVAVNWFGFPYSMGSPYHHYIIADDVIIPKDSEIFYSEKVLRLPCYQPNDRKRLVSSERPTRASLGLPDRTFVFCSFNGTHKLTEKMFKVWMHILRLVPESVLWLLAPGETRTRLIRERVAACGVDPSRVIFAPKFEHAQHLARYPLADLFLDSFPYGAHTTASDSLWMGIPLLTMAGKSFPSRVCASLVTAAGIPELSAHDYEDYTRKAVALALNPTMHAQIKQRLAQTRDTCVLFDTTLLVRSLESLYETMRMDYDSGMRPEPDLRNLDCYLEAALKRDLENSEYLSHEAYVDEYRRILREMSATYPIAEDNRLWNSKQLFSTEKFAVKRTVVGTPIELTQTIEA